MLHRSGRDNFVIVQEKDSEKFVQFAGSACKPLLLDLPNIILNTEERERADAFFAPLRASRKPLSANGEEFAYQLRLGQDVNRGAELALAVFRDVYRLPSGSQLVIIEGWNRA
jgi:hypothetical protein